MAERAWDRALYRLAQLRDRVEEVMNSGGFDLIGRLRASKNYDGTVLPLLYPRSDRIRRLAALQGLVADNQVDRTQAFGQLAGEIVGAQPHGQRISGAGRGCGSGYGR